MEWFGDFGKFCRVPWNFEKVLESLRSSVQFWGGLERFGEVWRGVGRFGEVWRGLGRFGEVWGGFGSGNVVFWSGGVVFGTGRVVLGRFGE